MIIAIITLGRRSVISISLLQVSPSNFLFEGYHRMFSRALAKNQQISLTKWYFRYKSSEKPTKGGNLRISFIG
jgi:hypothetical protein